MKDIPLNFVRKLTRREGGRSRKISLKINKLYFDKKTKQWRRDWSLDHLYPEAVHFPGHDPLEALTRTLDFASSFIRGTIIDGPEISWNSQGDMDGLLFAQSESADWKKKLPGRK